MTAPFLHWVFYCGHTGKSLGDYMECSLNVSCAVFGKRVTREQTMLIALRTILLLRPYTDTYTHILLECLPERPVKSD